MRLKIFIAATVPALTLMGCSKKFLNDKLDTYETPSTIATDRTTLFEFANAFYTSLPNGFVALDNNLFAAASDEAQQTATYSTGAQIFNQGGLNANSNPDGNSYQNLYEGIRAANFFLGYSINAYQFLSMNRDTVTDSVNFNRDKQYIAWYRGEAHVARAFYYMELIKRYGGVPLITSTLQETTNTLIPKSSYDSVVSFIESEINTYRDSLEVNWQTSPYQDQDGRFDLGAALAIKSRVLLYAASPLHNSTNDVTKWQAAASAARDVITTAGLDYALDGGGYGNYFLGNASVTSPETIFAVRNPANNAPEEANYPIATPGGHSGVTPTQNLVEDYEYIGPADPANPYNNRDPRLGASVVTNGSTWNGRTINEAPGGSDDMTMANTSRTGYYLKKFLDDNLNLVQGGTAVHNWVIFRFAETLLNYAEAMNEAYGPDMAPAGFPYTARQALTMVRNRASTSLAPVTVADVASFRAAVKHERRIELAFEDHRYWDLLRWQDAATVLNQPVQGVQVTQNGYSVVNVAGRVFPNPTMYYYPFSHTEIVNAQGTLEQNPGY
jgi:hypothetical protein